MRPLLVLAASIALGRAGAASSFPWLGSWVQLYSNAYVQNTLEVDWKCVNVTFTDRDGEVVFVKEASLHGGPERTRTYPAVATTEDSGTVLVLAPDGAAPALRNTRSRRRYLVRISDASMLVVTGLDDGSPSVYVWVRPDAVETLDPTPILDQLRLWEYTGLEKQPLLSYSLTECPV